MLAPKFRSSSAYGTAVDDPEKGGMGSTSAPVNLEDDGSYNWSSSLSQSSCIPSSYHHVADIAMDASTSSAMACWIPGSQVNARASTDRPCSRIELIDVKYEREQTTKPGSQTQWLLPAALNDGIDPQLCQHPVEPLATTQSTLHAFAPNSNEIICHRSQPSSLSPFLCAAASDATTHLTLPISNIVGSTTAMSKHALGFVPEPLYCGQCGTGFSGIYRRSNLKRHTKQKHSKVKPEPYACTVDGCHRIFARQDARLKHARIHHPGLYTEPVCRKQGCEKELAMTTQHFRTPSSDCISGSDPKHNHSDQNSCSSQSTMDIMAPSCSHNHNTSSSSSKVKGSSAACASSTVTRSSIPDPQGSSVAASMLDLDNRPGLLPTLRGPIDEDALLLEDQYGLWHEDAFLVETRELARIVFASLRAKLDAHTYSSLCNATFERWEVIIAKLRVQQSESYPVYAKVIQNLHSVIYTIENDATEPVRSDQALSCSPIFQPYKTEPNGPEGIRSSHPDFEIDGEYSLYPSSKFDPPEAFRHSVQGKEQDSPQKLKSRVAQRPEVLRWKTIRMSTPQPCCGSCETSTSQTRSCLNHIGFQDFAIAQQCSTGEKDFVYTEAHDGYKRMETHQHVAHSSNDVVFPRARSCITKYPNETRLLNPFCGEPSSWMHDSNLKEFGSILGQQDLDSNVSLVPATPAVPVQIDEMSYNMALHHVLQDTVAPACHQIYIPQAVMLARSVLQLSTMGSQAEEYFRSALQKVASRYFQILALVPAADQSGEIFAKADKLVQFTREYQRYGEHEIQNHFAY